MNPVLQQNLFFVKEHVGFFKAARNFDVLDPETGEIILLCREPNLGTFTRMLRFTDYRTMTPFDIHITLPDGTPVARVTRGISLFLSKVQVFDGDGELVGGFKQKFFSIGGAFTVLNAADEPLCTLQGKWTGWTYRFEHSGEVLAEVLKKWNGLGKELFTTADNYMLKISEQVPPENPLRVLIMGAVFCIDMVLKEKK